MGGLTAGANALPYTRKVLRHDRFERRAQATGTVGLAVLVAVFATLAYWQVFRSDLAAEETNPRIIASYRDPGRGSLLDREGNVLAMSERDGTRRYTDASVAHLLGYIDARYGSLGAELVFNDELSGQAPDSWDAALNAEFLRENPQGDDVRLTIDPDVQAAAAQALGSRKGAVVAIDPQTGEVLAMVSVPTYDPGGLAENGEALVEDEEAPLLNRVTQGLYPPGSTFKAVTAAAALEHGLLTPDTEVTCPGELVFDGFPISCANTSQGVGTYPFMHAFTYSVNAIFGQVAVDLGWARLNETARRFGFERQVDFILDTSTTQIRDPDAEATRPLLASTGFGQGELLATPLQMALVAATVANGGVMMKPIIGLSYGPDGGEGHTLETSSGERIIAEDVARDLRDFMVSVIEAGQAEGARVPGVTVAGKTGTAETGVEGVSHAWFIGFAPAENPSIAVAVIVEEGGFGSQVAAPIAGAVMAAALDE